MRATIDKAGRIVLPKTLRDQYDLFPGAELEIQPGESSIALIPKHFESHLVIEDGVCVHTGRTSGDMLGAIDRVRNARLHVAGGFKPAG